MPRQLQSILFATVLCVVCSLLLTAASTGLQSRQQRNMLVDRRKNILKAFGLIGEDADVTARQVQDLFRRSVRSLRVDEAGRIRTEDEAGPNGLPIYVYVRNQRIEAYGVPIDTRGLWGRIHGYLAIENDGATIRGFTVYKHSETPGLGGEIESRWFRKNFEHKRIVDGAGKFVSIGIAKGGVDAAIPKSEQPNYVDGISGATLTGKYLSAGLKKILQDYEPMAIQFRHHNPRYLRTP